MLDCIYKQITTISGVTMRELQIFSWRECKTGRNRVLGRSYLSGQIWHIKALISARLRRYDLKLRKAVYEEWATIWMYIPE